MSDRPPPTDPRLRRAAAHADAGRPPSLRSLPGPDGVRLAAWLEGPTDAPRLAVLAPPDDPALANGTWTDRTPDGPDAVARGPADATNAAWLRATFPALRPQPLGPGASAGFGDRLGLATPGHVRALRAADPHGTIRPIYAQQSIREMGRTGRTPQAVMDDATWGAFEAGHDGPLGADADHLKTADDVRATAAAGFTLFTFDPGDRVDDAADHATGATLDAKLDALPWDALETTKADHLRRYGGRRLELGAGALEVTPEDAARAAAKYGAALAHARALHAALVATRAPHEIEISVDETGTPTRPVEHALLALELRRLELPVVSLAPRFVGRFEKGVDFRGDLGALRATLDVHGAIATQLGGYKLSLHSGSDKFSVYPLIAAATHGAVHLKTAGTSYLEALRVAATRAPDLFRAILATARAHFETDRASYLIGADLARVPAPDALADADLPALLDDDDARQVLHVTYGSALDAHRPALRDLLLREHEVHAATLERHFVRHLTPFVGPTDATGAAARPKESA